MALTLEVKVVPSSGRQQWSVDKQGMLKCHLKSPPERGLANAECIDLLSKALYVPKAALRIIAGHTGRKKLISIDAQITLPQVLNALGIEIQQSFVPKK